MKYQALRAVTILYLLLPSFLFIYGWLRFPFAIILLIILASFTGVVFVDLFRSVANRQPFYEMKRGQVLARDSVSGIVPAVLLIAIWLAFSGTGGIGFQNDDHRASNALLHDLITQDWPLKTVMEGRQVPVVYYVAYYLPAAVIGKAVGWVGANIFLFLWTLQGIVLAFAWFWKLSRINLKNRALRVGFLLAEIFCLAGGLDYVGSYVLDGNIFNPSAHIESWAGYFEYASNTTLIYWVPQHTIAAWLVIGMIVDALYNRQNLKYLGMVLSAAVIWSPFGIVGAAPYFLLILFVYLQPHNRRYLWNWESIVFNALSIGMGAIFLLYLGSNQFNFPIGFIWQFSKNYMDLALRLLAFWSLEFAILGFLILLLIVLGVSFSRPRVFSQYGDQQWAAPLEQEFGVQPIQLCLFLISLAVLGALPLFRMGIKNDLVMRGSIASLFTFWAFIAKLIADVSLRVRTKFKLIYTLISVVLAIGFLTSFNEIDRSLTRYHFGPPVLSMSVTSANVNDTETVLQRIGSEDSLFYRYLGK